MTAKLIDDFQFLVYINSFRWDWNDQFWFALGKVQAVPWVVPMPPVCVASYMLRWSELIGGRVERKS